MSGKALIRCELKLAAYQREAREERTMLLSTGFDPDGQPFVVEAHAFMVTQCAGKVPGTVLTLEMQLANFRICEWIEPWNWQRQWCFANLQTALVALAFYVNDAAAIEPKGWVRAIDGNGVRRQSLEAAAAQFEASLVEANRSEEEASHARG